MVFHTEDEVERIEIAPLAKGTHRVANSMVPQTSSPLKKSSGIKTYFSGKLCVG